MTLVYDMYIPSNVVRFENLYYNDPIFEFFTVIITAKMKHHSKIIASTVLSKCSNLENKLISMVSWLMC